MQLPALVQQEGLCRKDCACAVRQLPCMLQCGSIASLWNTRTWVLSADIGANLMDSMYQGESDRRHCLCTFNCTGLQDLSSPLDRQIALTMS